MARVLLLAGLALAASAAECGPVAAETCAPNGAETAQSASLLQSAARRDRSSVAARDGEGAHEQLTEAADTSSAINAVALEGGDGPCGLRVFEDVSSDATYNDVRGALEEKCRTCQHPHPASICEAVADEAFKPVDLAASFDEEPGSLLCKSIKLLVEAHIKWVEEIDPSTGEEDVALIKECSKRRSLETQSLDSKLDSMLKGNKCRR